MKIWKVILATLVIFCAGVITGGLLVNHVVRPKQKANKPLPVQAQGITPWQQRGKELLHRMDRELTLTQEQREHIERILARSQDRTKEIWNPIVPTMNREFTRTREEIREQLTPEQRKKFDELSKPRQPKKTDGRHAGTNAPLAELPTNAVPTNAAPGNP